MFTTYVAAMLPDILVESSTGTRPSVNGMYDVTQTSALRLFITRELPLGCFKATWYTADNVAHCVKVGVAKVRQQGLFLCDTNV